MGRRAFTLIELLVVIAVIAILAGLLLPSLARAREEARKSLCRSNMKQIGLSCIMYGNDFGGVWPRKTGPIVLPDVLGDWAGDDWDASFCLKLLYPGYLKAGRVMGCPSTDTQGGLAGWAGMILITTSYLYDPQKSARANAMTARAAEWAKGLVAGYQNCGAGHTSENHKYGTNVLYQDGRVEWQNAGANFYVADPSIFTFTQVDPDTVSDWDFDWDEFSQSWIRYQGTGG